MRKTATDTQHGCLKAVAELTERLGRAPSTQEVATELGINKPSARNLMLRCKQKGLMRAPEMVLTGEWALTAAGRKEIAK